MGVAGKRAKEKPVHGRLLYNLRMPRTVRKFCFVAFFTCLTIANWSSQEARGQVTDKKYTCSSAIQATTPKWETGNSYRSFVVKAKQLGLSERDCARLTGRFGERQLRLANSNLEKVKAKKPKAEARSSLKDNQSLQGKIATLKKEIKNLLSKNKNLNSKLEKVQSTSKTARKTLEKKQTTLENEVAGFDKLFREAVGRNNAIRKSMSDIETRSKENQKAIENIRKRPGPNKGVDKLRAEFTSLSSRSTRLEGRLNETQRDFRTLLRSHSELVDQTKQITETLKTPKGEPKTPNIENVASSEDTFAPGIEMTDLLIYLIPAMLFLGGLGVIVLVMVRKNRDRKRLEAETMRYSSTNNAPKTNNNETPSAAPGPWEKTDTDTTKTT